MNREEFRIQKAKNHLPLGAEILEISDWSSRKGFRSVYQRFAVSFLLDGKKFRTVLSGQKDKEKRK